MLNKGEIAETIYNTFESLKHVDENGVEFWYGHDLARALGYTRYGNFIPAINRAKASIAGRGINPDLHIQYCEEEYITGLGVKSKISGCKEAQIALSETEPCGCTGKITL